MISELDEKIYDLAKIIFEARKIDAWGKNHRFVTPQRKGYNHNPEADFDMAIACAKAVMKNYKLTTKEQQP